MLLPFELLQVLIDVHKHFVKVSLIIFPTGRCTLLACIFYLQVLPSILFVKANNGEASESLKFQRLACADLSERLKKKKMKALIPQIVQIIYFGVLFIFCFGSLAVSGGSFDCSRLVAFMTSLVLLIKPIQVLLFFLKDFLSMISLFESVEVLFL